MTTLLKKLSVKNICPIIKAPTVGEEVPLCVVMGFVRTSEIKRTTFGDSVGFHGDFKGINVETSEEFRSGTCYLPDVAEHLLFKALENSEGNSVEFGFSISVIGVKGRDGDEGSKYEYRVKPLMPAQENDPLNALEQRLKSLALPKPAPVEHAVKKGGK